MIVGVLVGVAVFVGVGVLVGVGVFVDVVVGGGVGVVVDCPRSLRYSHMC